MSAQPEALFTEDGQPTAGARWTDSPESWNAANSLSRAALRDSNAWVLGAVKQLGPCTDSQIEALGIRQGVRYSPARIRSARAWLVQRGYVVRVGDGLSFRKRPCALWAVTG